MKRILLLAFLCLQTLILSAEVVKCRVVDSESGEPLENAEVEVWLREGLNLSINKDNCDSCGVYVFPTGSYMCEMTMTFRYFGYEELKMKPRMLSGGKDTLDLGDIKMKMSPELLKEIVVKGKAKQFYMKGDTVVFNPEAFNLDDGARVAELLKKLPGVRIEDGALTFNGKPVHLKMNGHDMMDDFLTGMLPAEAVQNVKAYEKKSEKAELTGVNDGEEQQILDITIKPGFLDKWYGQTKASAYASKNYRLSANMHYLSEKNPWGIYGRVSDNGTQTGSVYDNGEWDNETALPLRQQYGKVSYQHNWKPSFVESSYEDKWWINSSPQHLYTHQNSWTNKETFLGGQPSAFNTNHTYNCNDGWEMPLSFGTYVHFSPKTFLQFNLGGKFKRSDESRKSEEQTYNASAYDDNPQQLVNSSTTDHFGRTDNGSMNSNLTLQHIFDKGSFNADLIMNYRHSQGTSESHSEYDYQSLGTTETLLQTATNKSDIFQTVFDAKLDYKLIPKKMELGVGYRIDYQHMTDNSDNYRNESFDFANSYDRKKKYFVNEPRVEVNADLGKLWMHAQVNMQNLEEHFDYQRGNLDTLVRRNTWFPRPSLDFKLKTTKTTELSGGASWEYHVADLLGGLDYTDDTDPLYIIKGNPNLKANSDLFTNISYRMMFTKGQQILTWNLIYTRAFDPVADASIYNSQSGGYITTKANVDDRQRWSAKVIYDRALGKYFRMRNDISYNFTQDHGIKTMTSIGSSWEQFEQHVSACSGGVNVTFENNGWEANAGGRCSYDGVTYSDNTMSGQNLWDYRAWMEGKYKLKHWTFNLKGELVGNAGYLSDIMNRNRFSLNASITWKCLKNKGQLTLSAKDIFNKMDQVYYNISPTMRYETRSETFHRYLSLSFTYNIDAKAKKDKK